MTIEETIAWLKSKVLEKVHQLGLDVEMDDLVTAWEGDTIYVYPAEGTSEGPVYDNAD